MVLQTFTVLSVDATGEPASGLSQTDTKKPPHVNLNLTAEPDSEFPTQVEQVLADADTLHSDDE